MGWSCGVSAFRSRCQAPETKEGNHEGAFVSQKDLHEMQDCSAAWSGAGDLREPQAQTTAGMMDAGVCGADSSGAASKVDETGGLKWQELRAWICRPKSARKLA
jgi:hypothetical protein